MAKTAVVSARPEVQRFAQELRAWRTRRGLSQLDLALRTGTTQRHLSFMEQGRSSPGRTMVVRLAESLELGLRERNALLLTAGYAHPYPESELHGPVLRPVRDAVTSILAGHEPYPAMVVRPDGEVVAWNSSVDVLLDGADPALTTPPFNGYRLALHPMGMAPRIRNLPEWGQHVLGALRVATRRTPSEGLDRLVAELEAYVPPPTPGAEHLGFAVPLRLACPEGELTLITTLTSFATAVDVTLAELRLEAFLPADDESATILRTRAAGREPSASWADRA